MKKLLLAGALGIAFTGNAQVWSENFNAAGLPTGWVMVKVDNNTAASQLGTLGTALNTNAWAKRAKSATDSCYGTTSWFAPAGQADRWLISKSFQVMSANTYLYWEDFAQDPTYTDSLQILVSTTAGTTPSAFGPAIYNKKGATTGFVKKGLDLTAYNGQTIRVAFRNNSVDDYLLNIDNIGTEVPAQKDLRLVSVDPVGSHPRAYGTVGQNITISGVVNNIGYTTVTSYTVKYQQGANAPVAQTFSGSIPLYGSAAFTMSTPYSISAVGSLPIKVWVELTGDANHTNDTLANTFVGVPSKPTKKIAFEEATGTWCGWCPRGMVWMENTYNQYPNQTTLIAVHNQDPMTITAYDAKIGATPGFSGYPGVIVDRREVIDPSDMITTYTDEKDYFGFADVSFSKPVISGTTLTTTASVKPHTNLSGDYRLAMVITEDRVHGTTTAYDQENYYSSTSQNQPLTGAGRNWQTSPNPVPAAQMYYDFVARAIVPSPDGAAGSLPSTMTTGSTYTYNFNTTLDASWNKNKVRVAVLLIRNSDGMVLNSNSTVWPTDVKNIASANDLAIYPNPTKDNAHVSFNLDSKSNVQVQVLDAVGRVVMNVANQTMEAGDHNVTVSTSTLVPGIYNVKITTEAGSVTERMTVIK